MILGGKYGPMLSALIAQALTFASLYWNGGPDAKYVAIAVGVAGALGVHITHVNANSNNGYGITQWTSLNRGLSNLEQQLAETGTNFNSRILAIERRLPPPPAAPTPIIPNPR